MITNQPPPVQHATRTPSSINAPSQHLASILQPVTTTVHAEPDIEPMALTRRMRDSSDSLSPGRSIEFSSPRVWSVILSAPHPSLARIRARRFRCRSPVERDGYLRGCGVRVWRGVLGLFGLFVGMDWSGWERLYDLWVCIWIWIGGRGSVHVFFAFLFSLSFLFPFFPLLTYLHCYDIQLARIS